MQKSYEAKCNEVRGALRADKARWLEDSGQSSSCMYHMHAVCYIRKVLSNNTAK